jgi:Protein of unknown function (DUF3800)
MRPEAPVVAFDESGNTGDNLLDETQPVCALASLHLADADAEALVAEVLPSGRRELHFAQLRGSGEGRRAILQVLDSALINWRSARITAMHKPFAVVARFFDYIIEPTIYERGRDVIAAGTQLDFPNVLYRRGPAACGEELWQELLAAFVSLMRAPGDERLDRFMSAHRACLLAAGHPLVRLILEDVPDREEVGRRVRIDQPAGIGGHDLLDPAPTMLVENCITWPSRLGSSIRVVHDESNVIRRWIPLIQSLSQPNAADVVGPYWGDIMPLPLRVERIQLIPSHHSPLVQLADIIGGASVTWLVDQITPGGQWARFAQQLEATGVPNFIENEVWPMPRTPLSRFR